MEILDGAGLNLNKFEAKNVVVHKLSSAPGSPTAGLIYYDTTLHQFGVYQNTTWTYLGATPANIVTKSSNASAANVMQVSGGTDKTLTDFISAGGLVKVSSTGVVTIATPGTDYVIPSGLSGYELISNKNASSGYAGITATYQLQLKNIANTFTSLLQNTNTAIRTYTLQDRNGTIADDTDITGAKARANHTGTQLSSTISDFSSAALTAAPAETATSLGNLTNSLGAETTIADGDLFPFSDVSVSNIWKKITWANIKATLITYIDSLNYLTQSSTHTVTNKTINASNNTISNLTTTMFAGNVIDNDATLAANSSTRLATQQATKAYIDTTVQSLKWKENARIATQGAETYTISSGAVTQISGTTVDGVTGAVNDLILIKNAPASSGAGAGANTSNTTQPANGLYIITNATTNLTVNRHNSADTSLEIRGMIAQVLEGTSNADTAWHMITDGAITLNTTGLLYNVFNLAGIPNATTVVAGKTRYATDPEAQAITITNAALTPSNIGPIINQKKLSVASEENIGDGSTTVFVLDMLNDFGVEYTKLMSVMVTNASTGEVVYPNIKIQNSITTLTVSFGVAPTTNQYKLLLIGLTY